MNELILAFWRHAEKHYRHEDGTPTSELNDYKLSLRPLRELYGPTPAADFSPLKLKAVRQRMIDADLCRGVTNQRVGRIVRMFKWAVSEEIAPETTWRSLTTVRGLERGRTEARETEPVKPVADIVVDATLPYVLPPVRAMIQVQRLAGMRPGEACVMRACDIDMSRQRLAIPADPHKTKHKGKSRVIALGPQAQAVVKPFLKLDTQAYLFSPRDGLAEVRAEKRRNRKTKVQPSQQSAGSDSRRGSRASDTPRRPTATRSVPQSRPPTGRGVRPMQGAEARRALRRLQSRGAAALAPPPVAAHARHGGSPAVRPGGCAGRRWVTPRPR